MATIADHQHLKYRYAGYSFRSASINGSIVNGNSNLIVCLASHIDRKFER
jgi:hypothetical protein